MKKRSRKYISKQKREYSPYCTICSGCGEDRCCSALCCKQHKDGIYCETYLRELKFAYLMYRDMYKHVPKEILDPIWDKNFEEIFERKVNISVLRKEMGVDPLSSIDIVQECDATVA